MELKPIINEKRNTTNICKKTLIFRYKVIIIINNITQINKAKNDYQTELSLIAQTKINHARELEDLNIRIIKVEENTNEYIESMNVRIKAYDDAIEAIKSISGGIDNKK